MLQPNQTAPPSPPTPPIAATMVTSCYFPNYLCYNSTIRVDCQRMASHLDGGFSSARRGALVGDPMTLGAEAAQWSRIPGSATRDVLLAARRGSYEPSGLASRRTGPQGKAHGRRALEMPGVGHVIVPDPPNPDVPDERLRGRHVPPAQRRCRPSVPDAERDIDRYEAPQPRAAMKADQVRSPRRRQSCRLLAAGEISFSAVDPLPFELFFRTAWPRPDLLGQHRDDRLQLIGR